MEKQVFTVKEFIQTLGISRSAAYKMIAAGRVQTIRLNHKILIPAVWVEKLLRGEHEKKDPAAVAGQGVKAIVFTVKL